LSTYLVDRKALTVIVNSLAETYPKVEVAAALDALRTPVSTGPPGRASRSRSRNVVAPPNKAQILEATSAAPTGAARVRAGPDHDEERRQELIEIWTHATAEVGAGHGGGLPETNSVLDDGQTPRPR